MKILNNAVANAPLAHVYELSDYMIVSGAMYNKNPMYPLPLKYGIMEDANSSVYLKETYDVRNSTNIPQRMNKLNYVLDNKNPKVHWGFFDNLGVRKLTETDEGITCEEVMNITESTDASVETLPQHFEYWTQNDDYIIFTWENLSSNTTRESKIIYFIYKDTFDVYYKYSYVGCRYLYDEYDDINNLYYIYMTADNGYFYKINLKNKELKEINSEITFYQTAPYAYNSSYASNLYNLDNTKSIWATFTNSNNTSNLAHNYTMLKAFNKDNKTYKMIKARNVILPSGFFYNYCFMPEENYILHTIIRPLTISSSNTIHVPQLFYYKVDGDLWSDNTTTISTENTVTLVNEYTDYHYTVCGRIGDDKTIFFANHEVISIYKWNTELKTYELYNSIYEDIEKICIDANNNLWIYNSNKDLYIPDFDYFEHEIILETDETDFDYNDEDIQTSIRVKCIDEKGNHVKLKVKLMITGVAKFTETNSNTIEISLNGEEVTVPVTIFGKGIVNISYIE